MWSSNAVRALGAAALAALCAPAMAGEDLRALEVVGQRGQSLEQTRRDAAERVLAGAVVGAAIGAATADGREREAEAEAEVAEPSDYLRALTACLEGRGYSVHLPSEAELIASR